MKTIILLGAAPIRGTIRFPSEGAFTVTAAEPQSADDRFVTADEAESLIEVGLAKPDNLRTLKVGELRDVAEDEGANVGPTATKSDLVEAIVDHRENKDGGANA